MKNLTDLDIWKSHFGLLPIHLNSLKNPDSSEFILLNGGYGDFCIHNNGDRKEPEHYFSKAWSANTKFFVHIDEEKASLFNWEKQKQEDLKVSDIVNNLDKFYNYLLNKSYKTQNDVVPFILDVFKRLRNITQEVNQPTEALNLLFYLLISVDSDDFQGVDSSKWRVQEVNLPSQFNLYREMLLEGFGPVRPDLSLILRHVSGLLFQEAQKEVLYFNPQIDLFGSISNIQKSKKNLYSSVHYTPQYLARSVVENVINNINLSSPSLKVIDPACGASEFLVEILKQLQEKGYKGTLHIIGWDISESAVSSSNFLLNYEKNIYWQDRLTFDIQLVEDSLTQHWDNDYDIIVMNPPYTSFELVKNRESKNIIKDTLTHVFPKGKPNIASAFFYKASQHLNENGVLGCVIPSSILTFESYKILRQEISERLDIKLIGRFGNFVFENALTDVSIFMGRNEETKRIPTLLWGVNEKGIAQNILRDLRKMQTTKQSSIDEKSHSIYRPSRFPIIENSWKPLSLSGSKFYKDIERYVAEGKLIRLSEVFSVRQGIRMGLKEIFKINPLEYEALPENEKYLFRPVIENSTVKNGQLRMTNYIWYPYNKQGAVFKKESELENISFYKEKIFPAKARLERRAGITNWWTHTRPRNWQFEMESKLVSTEFGRASSFAFDITGEYVLERGNAWLPKRKFKEDDYYFYLAFFTSDVFNKLLSIYNAPLVDGKSFNLGKKYSQHIPIPDVFNNDLRFSDIYSKMANMGQALANGNNFILGQSTQLIKNYIYPSIS